MKFGTLQQLVNQIAVSSLKIEIFNIPDGGGRNLENRFFGHNSSTDCPISATFCMRKQNGMSTRATWKKLQFFLKSKMADGRHFVNRKIAISQWKIVRFWWYLVHCIRYWTPWQPRDQKLKFLKFKMAVATILKIAFLAITHRRFSNFGEILCEEAERHPDKGHMTKTANYWNRRWRTAAILKTVKSPYLSENIIGFWQYLVYYSIY